MISLAEEYPDIAKEWHPTKNKGVTPQDVTPGSHYKAWWLLPYEDPKTGKCFNFEWNAVVKSRVNGNKCPYLSGHAIWKGWNDLETTNPEIAKEWNYERNKNLVDGNGRDISTPDKITAKSRQNIWWKKIYF